MTSPDDEFRFLQADAERVGRSGPLPRVERVEAALSDGRVVSGIAFSPEDAPQLVALHGAGLNAHSFDPTLLALDVPALAVDLPGHGRSSWRDDADYGPVSLAADTAQALAQLAPSPHVLVGHSLGGLTAALLAVPDRVTQLVLVDITPGVSPVADAGAVTDFIQGQRDYATVDEIVDRALAFGIGDDREALTRGVALNTRRRPDGRLEWTHHFAHLTGLPGAADLGPQPFAPLWAILETLTIPVSLIRAESGMVSESHVAEWHERLPGSRIISIPGPHNLHEARPVELAAALRELLK